MGRGVSVGGGQSSLGYLFGGGENTNNNTNHRASRSEGQISSNMTTAFAAPSKPLDNSPQVPIADVDSKIEADNSKPSPTGTHESRKNNYFRPDGQNCGNFITDRPSTKVHAAPGGGSSLGYLFGAGKN